MELEKFIDSLSLSSFDELRKVVIAKHRRHSEEVVRALEYLTSQSVLCKAAISNRDVCENVLAEKTKLPKELMVKVVDRYLQLKDHFNTHDKPQNNSVDRPFSKS